MYTNELDNITVTALVIIQTNKESDMLPMPIIFLSVRNAYAVRTKKL